ncbi:MAG TPA: trypsin-like peptidase domain-containing protein [Labilithrix sp.]|nr:trypsin-like peptidase domain-containing protein [Labilithrix sp.]
MMADSSSRFVFALFTGAVVLGASACAGPSQVSFVSTERPSSAGAPQGLSAAGAHHEHPNGSHELPNDAEVVEPERPAAETKQERALVHIHGPDGVVCSGVVLGPRVIATAQQCLKGEGRGVTLLPAGREYKIEIASSTLTWTSRSAKYAVLPSCEWTDLDVGLLVLEGPAPWVQPLKIASAPGTGGRVQALGFGRCAGRGVSMKDRVGTVRSRVSEAVVVDVPLCKGDVGGPVIDGPDGEVIGLISHRDDPEGSPLHTTTIVRLDTTSARELLAQAQQITDGPDATKAKPVACR